MWKRSNEIWTFCIWLTLLFSANKCCFTILDSMNVDYWTRLTLYHLKDVSFTFKNYFSMKEHLIYSNQFTYDVYGSLYIFTKYIYFSTLLIKLVNVNVCFTRVRIFELVQRVQQWSKRYNLKEYKDHRSWSWW